MGIGTPELCGLDKNSTGGEVEKDEVTTLLVGKIAERGVTSKATEGIGKEPLDDGVRVGGGEGTKVGELGEDINNKGEDGSVCDIITNGRNGKGKAAGTE